MPNQKAARKARQAAVVVTADPVALALNDNTVPATALPGQDPKQHQEMLEALGLATKPTDPKVAKLRAEVVELEKQVKAKKAELRAAETGGKVVSRVFGVSLYEAAIAILSVEKRPMGCKELVKLADERGLWSSPSGLTPDATLYARLLSDMNGKTPKVCRPAPGLFALRS